MGATLTKHINTTKRARSVCLSVIKELDAEVEFVNATNVFHRGVLENLDENIRKLQRF